MHTDIANQSASKFETLYLKRKAVVSFWYVRDHRQTIAHECDTTFHNLIIKTLRKCENEQIQYVQMLIFIYSVCMQLNANFSL